MRLRACVLIVSEGCVVLPTSCQTIIEVAKKTRLVPHTISYTVYVNLITLCRLRASMLCDIGKGETA